MLKMSRNVIRVLAENSMFLLVGAVLAIVMANISFEAYHKVAEPLHFLVNEVMMAIFFGRAAKEIREAMLPGGKLSDLKTAALPLLATLGGMLGPALVYMVGVHVANEPVLARGWAIPTATDIAFSYMVARYTLGANHPAIPFLLLLAIADDGGGLAILALFYQSGEGNLVVGLPLIGVSLLVGYIMNRHLRMRNFWPYLMVPGSLSWFGFYMAGIHPALALVPIVWCIPHEHTDKGLYEAEEEQGDDALNQFASWWKNPTELILLLFGFVSAGVVVNTVGAGTYLVGAGLLLGKPLGISLFTLIGLKAGLRLPGGMNTKDVVVVGSIAGIGFTVALFVSGVAFPAAGAVQDSLKLGALASFLSAPAAIVLAKVLRVGRFAK